MLVESSVAPSVDPKFFWQRIVLGDDFCKKSLIAAIKNRGRRISPGAEAMIQSFGFRLSGERQEIDLVLVTGKDLGLHSETGLVSLGTLYFAAERCGLQLCPQEAAPKIMFLPDECIAGRTIFIGTDPVQMDVLKIFCIQHKDGRVVLDETFGSPARKFCAANWLFVFVAKKEI